MKSILKFPRDLTEIEKKINYKFKDFGLLEKALTHSSAANELHAKGIDIDCNERLEFLGDSVLSLVVAQYLYSRFEKIDEGYLSKIRASVVCEKALAQYARTLSLGEYIRFGHGEEKSGGRSRSSTVSDAFEAIIGAIYLDSGSIGPAEKFVLPFVSKEISEINKSASFIDHKTELQQIVQQVEGEKLRYVIVSESGPDHDKVFEVEARLNSNVIGRGKAGTKREAEQRAAEEALRLFGK